MGEVGAVDTQVSSILSGSQEKVMPDIWVIENE